MSSYVDELQAVQAGNPEAAQVDLAPLKEAAADWGAASGRLESRADALLAAGDTDGGRASRAIARINDALVKQERALTTSRGLPGRPWFRHQIYAPGLEDVSLLARTYRGRRFETRSVRDARDPAARQPSRYPVRD